jgi:hypothetical protein
VVKRKRTIRICSQEWKLQKDCRKHGGGSFVTDGGRGTGVMVIGTKGQDNQYILKVMIHEILESILTVQGRRWAESSTSAVFVFSHNQMEDICWSILDAMTSCGMVDPKKKII